MKIWIQVLFFTLLVSCGGSKPNDEVSVPPKITFLNTILDFDSLDKISLKADVSDNNEISSFNWELESDQGVEFSFSDLTLTLVAPMVEETTELVFSLTVVDNNGLQSTENVEIYIHPPTTSIGTYSHIVISDLNNDQLDDIILSNESTLSWYKNQGNGLFSREKLISNFDQNINNIYIKKSVDDDSREIFVSTEEQYFVMTYQLNEFSPSTLVSSNWPIDDPSICKGTDGILEDITKDGFSDIIWSADCVTKPYYSFGKVLFVAKGLGNGEFSSPIALRSYEDGGINFRENMHSFVGMDLDNDSFKELIVYHSKHGTGFLNEYIFTKIKYEQDEPQFTKLYSRNFSFQTDENGNEVSEQAGYSYGDFDLPALRLVDINNDANLDILATMTLGNKSEVSQIIFEKDSNEYIEKDYNSLPLIFNHIRDLNFDGNNDLILIAERQSANGSPVSYISWQENMGSAFTELKEIYIGNELYKQILIGSFDANNILDFLLITDEGELEYILR